MNWLRFWFWMCAVAALVNWVFFIALTHHMISLIAALMATGAAFYAYSTDRKLNR